MFRPLPALLLLALTLPAGQAHAQDTVSPGADDGSEPTSAAASTAFSDTIRAVVSLAQESHYRSETAVVTAQSALVARTREAFLRHLDPHGDLLSPADIATLDTGAVATALTDGSLEQIEALGARQTERLSQRVAWVTARAQGGDVASTPDSAWEQRYRRTLVTLQAQGLTTEQARALMVARMQRLLARAEARSRIDMLEAFLDDFLLSLDPHSGYVPPPRRDRAANRTRRRPPSDLYGIGALLGFSGDYVQLRRLLNGGSAERSALLNAGDRIVGVIDGAGAPPLRTDVVGWAIEDVADIVRGPPGSQVTLDILPRGLPATAPTSRVTLTRDRIRRERRRVSAQLIEQGGTQIGVITIPSFYVDYAGLGRGDANYDSSASDLTRELLRLQREANGLDAVLLDMRGNGGGALIEAVRIVGLFINAGPVVRVRHASGGVEVFEDENEGRVWNGPLAVLVDRYSASASEIVAAALQDYRRALVIGELTYGKGSVQEPFDLAMRTGYPRASGRVSLTTAAFYRVNGESTQLQGVAPDVMLPVSLTNGRYGERFELWPLPPQQIDVARYETETNLDERLRQPLNVVARSARLWARRPAYLGDAAVDEDPAAIVEAHRSAPAAREAFRELLRNEMGDTAPGDDAPLTALWARLVLQDALAVVRALVGGGIPDNAASSDADAK